MPPLKYLCGNCFSRSVPSTPSNQDSIKVTQAGLKPYFFWDLDFIISSSLSTKTAPLKIARTLLAFLLHCFVKNPRTGVISTSMEMPKDAKDQLFMNRKLLPTLSL